MGEESAADIAARMTELAARLKATGDYSIEAATLIELSAEVATLAVRVAAIERAMLHDLPGLVQRVIDGAYPPTPLPPPGRGQA